MQKRKISFELTIFESFEELSKEDQMLMSKAIAARKNAYAPYSNFQVGASLLLANGKTIIGNNQENASYPSGLCAERVAVFHAGATYPDTTIEAIAITAASKAYIVDTPVAPCGNCRQSISEYEVKQKSSIRLLLMGEQGKVFQCDSIGDMLPLGFDGSFLK